MFIIYERLASPQIEHFKEEAEKCS
jgi:hypothetical protein